MMMMNNDEVSMDVTECTNAELISIIDDWFRDEIWACSAATVAQAVLELDKRRK